MRKQHHGITAFDLLVCMAIVAILLTTAVPGLQAWTLNHSMSAAVATLQADLQFARAEAIRLRSHTVVCPGQPGAGCDDSAAWESGWMLFADPNGDREWQTNEPVLRQSPVQGTLSIASSLARNRLKFTPQGAAPASNATLTFCDVRGAAHARQLRLSASGRIRRLGPGEAGIVQC
jgi:type IV fimbrial biogenesis protein FimT